MRLLALTACLLLAGCARSIYDFTPTMDADPPELGIEGLVLMNELGRAYETLDETESITCGQTRPSNQERQKYSYTRHNQLGRKTEDAFRCIGYRPSPKLEDVRRHLQAGFGLSTLYCHNFFRRIAERANKRRFARSGVNDVGAGVSTALGLAAAGSGVTGGVGAGFGLIDSLFRNYDESFLVDADLRTLQGNVFTKQDALREDVYGKNLMSYADAEMAIRRHADLCSYTGMKALLEKAVVRDTEAFAANDAAVAAQVDAATLKERAETERKERLAAYAERAAAAETKRKAAEAQLSGTTTAQQPTTEQPSRVEEEQTSSRDD